MTTIHSRHSRTPRHFGTLLAFGLLSAAAAPGCAASTGDGYDGSSTDSERTETSQSSLSFAGCLIAGNPMAPQSTLRVWMANHMALVNALLQNKIPFDQASFVKVTPGSASSNIELSSAQVPKDLKYKVRGVLEVINSNDESRTKLNAVWANLPASGGVTFASTPFAYAQECSGSPLVFQDGAPRPLTTYRLAISALDYKKFGTYVRKPFEDAGNQLFATSSTVININYAEFDPVASPDGFGVAASSGSCTEYATTAISTTETDSRFYNGGVCDPLSGANCVSCNLTGETSCASRVVWRRVGSTSAWRCRAI